MGDVIVCEVVVWVLFVFVLKLVVDFGRFYVMELVVVKVGLLVDIDLKVLEVYVDVGVEFVFVLIVQFLQVVWVIYQIYIVLDCLGDVFDSFLVSVCLLVLVRGLGDVDGIGLEVMLCKMENVVFSGDLKLVIVEVGVFLDSVKVVVVDWVQCVEVCVVVDDLID